MIDLGAWLKGDYFIQGGDEEGETDQDADESVKWRSEDDT
jgi:endogenous inhibitor of DNA gyrase (YacG/DUF329 family)